MVYDANCSLQKLAQLPPSGQQQSISKVKEFRNFHRAPPNPADTGHSAYVATEIELLVAKIDGSL